MITSSGVTRGGNWWTRFAGNGCGVIKSTASPMRFLQNLVAGEQKTVNPLAKPTHTCCCCGTYIYKGVRIDGEKHFCIKDYNTYEWAVWFLENVKDINLCQLYHLNVEHYTDNGTTNTLLND